MRDILILIMLRLIALTLSLSSFCALAQSQIQALYLDPQRQEISLSGEFEYLEDKHGDMRLDQVKQSPDWKPLAGMPEFGFTQSAIWLRLRVEQVDSPKIEWRLTIKNPLIESARLWVPEADGKLIEWHSGPSLHSAAWPAHNRYPTFELRPPPGGHTLYLRLHGGYASLSTQIRLWTAEEFSLHSSREALFFGGFFGIFIFHIAMQLVFWLMARDRSGNWYLLYALTLLIGTTLGSGYPLQYLDLTAGALANIVGLYLCLLPAVLTRLSCIWLDLAKQRPRFNFYFQAFAYGMAIFTCLQVLAGKQMLAVQVSHVTSLICLLAALMIALWQAKLRSANAIHYLLVFSCIDIAVVIRFLRNLGGLPPNFITDHATHIGITLHMTAMSLYVIYRYRLTLASLRRPPGIE